MATSVYSSEALIRASAPVKEAVDVFMAGVSEEGNDPSTQCNSQSQFISLILSISQQSIVEENTANQGECEDVVDWKTINFLPSRRYVHRLVQRYTSQLEEHNIGLEDDNLASLVCHFSMSRWNNLPDPTSSCIVTFRIPKFYVGNVEDGAPSQSESADKSIQSDILQIRTYPHHNDVGVSKVWEAGACLSEYIIHNPNLIRDKDIVELGAGVGLTGIAASGMAHAKSVHMTDYTRVTLDNMAYNICENRDWFVWRGVAPETVTAGKLEWGAYSSVANGSEDSIYYSSHHVHNHPWADSIEALSKANVLLAADVVYDINCIPDLVATVCKFLSQTQQSPESDNERMAIFATTYRNKDTFALFEKELEEQSITCEYHMDGLPNIFPCYWNQPRADVRVAHMKLKR